MKKSFSFIFIFIFVVFVLSGIFVRQASLGPSDESARTVSGDRYGRAEIKIGDKAFDAYVSDTEILREKGLSGFAGLDENEAMLFIFPESGLYGFWMKDMLFSIDILWLDDSYRVVSFEKNISPDTFPKSFYPKNPSRYVVELKSDVLDETAIAEGDQVFIASATRGK